MARIWMKACWGLKGCFETSSWESCFFKLGVDIQNTMLHESDRTPSNAISIFPHDIRHIASYTHLKWDEIAQPDSYSCFSDRDNLWAIGWILRRNNEGECVFYKKGRCTIYELRPIICRCYPYFLDENCSIEVFHCDLHGNTMSEQTSIVMGHLVKRYELKKLQSYIHIIAQVGDILKISNFRLVHEALIQNNDNCDEYSRATAYHCTLPPLNSVNAIQ